MPLFNSQIPWRGIGTTVVVELLVLLALAFAVVRYVEWSSDVALTEFMSASKPSAASDTGEFFVLNQALKRQTSCSRKG
jgi:hypothetical protein